MLPSQDFKVVVKRLNEYGYSSFKEYWKSEHWKKLKQQFGYYRPYRCHSCSSAERLALHHKTYDRLCAEKIDDLMFLCEICHTKVHSFGRDVRKDTGIVLSKGKSIENWKRKEERKIREKLHGLPAKIIWVGCIPKIVPLD